MASIAPPNQEPKWAAAISPPTIGPGGTASLICSTAIAAPPSTCAEVVLDTTAYSAWNRWIPEAPIQTPSKAAATLTPASLRHLAAKPEQMLLAGTEFTFQVHMDPDAASYDNTELVVSLLEEFERDGRRGLRVAWKTRGDPWYLRAERTQEFVENGEGGTDYTCFETFQGPAAWLVKLAVGAKLVQGFGLWMTGLKKAAEEKAQHAGH
ncbi:Uu.00g112750.m01.CDS01 [Anthostomella pinea]|uniref:Uu.00g112750.m01.CDS01 n=1 Tax=Anthostomella pinea TaxID=933095 RepID=A0AAI8VG15_9PEZI|nr:Uu.00g112750.m01.CDS01 [Anthostomella pinea]